MKLSHLKASYYPEQKSSALEKQDWTKYLTQDGGEEQDWRQYMVGEQFFKDGADDSSEDEEYGDQYDYLPYKVLDKNEVRKQFELTGKYD